MLYLKADVSKPLSYISCGKFVNDEGFIHKRRVIDSFEIILGVEGTLYISQDGEKYEVSQGKVLMLLPSHTHMGYKNSNGKVAFYWMHFKCTQNFELINAREAQSFLHSLCFYPYFKSVCTSVVIPTFFESSDSERLTVLIRQLLHYSNSKDCIDLVNSYLITLILMELSKEAVSTLCGGNAKESGRKFSDIIEWLRINCDKNYSVEEIADINGFNKDYLTRLFKKNTGMPIRKYINGMKIAAAKNLLLSSDLSVKEISYKLGITDEKYFMKLFKSFENLTPTEYRNSFYRIHLNKK